jgi:Alw26I/Eco31I/Esp3I family type II restriction m6 adenine DNA methyltransferase
VSGSTGLRSEPDGGIEAVTQRSVDRAAKQLRNRLAVRLGPGFVRDFEPRAWTEVVENSPFREHLQSAPFDEPLLFLAFNLDVTRRAVDGLRESQVDPANLAFTAARVAELGLYSLHDPRHPQQEPKLFLAASKQLGYFFTPPEVAFLMADRALKDRTRIERLLDPGAGLGSLLAATLITAKQRGTVVQSVEGIELDPFTGGICANVLDRVCELIETPCHVQVVQGDAVDLLFRAALSRSGQYDCIVMNPPYGRIKFLRSFLTNAETRVDTTARTVDQQDVLWKQRASNRAEYFRAISGHLGLGSGPQDYQRLFMGLAIASLSESGRLALISPSSWLGDSDSRRLRTRIVRGRLLEEVIVYPEGVGLFATVNQPTAVAVLAKGPSDSEFTLRLVETGIGDDNGSYGVRFDTLEKLDPERLRIPRISHGLHEVYESLQAFPRLKEYAHLRNARGELDLTFGKAFITSSPRSLRLVRGDHIERYILREPEQSKRAGYVDERSFTKEFAGRRKLDDLRRWRVAGRQCSYLSKGRRLSFALVPPGVVLANSCNYISLPDGASDAPDTLLKALTVLLNSIVIEWYFRIFNSNNHVANYEIDDFPLCLSDPEMTRVIARQADFLHAAYQSVDSGGKLASAIEDVSDALVAYAYGLTPPQIETIAASIAPDRATRIAAVAEWLYQNGVSDSLVVGDGWYQHVLPRLSELDIEIIRHVPQGGNWRDIPESVPSQRLVQIREMTEWRGIVRTTYYGRLRPDQPAYTIATYYNRPGNGTNIHPWEDRTLTSREAARLQSFPDWYVFIGTDGSVRKQVGNAVPPLLAFALGDHLKGRNIDGPCVDLFAGAGGLSLGLELAGWEVAAAVDNDPKAGQTYGFNRPCEREPAAISGRTLFLEADLTLKAEQEAAVGQIRQKLGTRRLALLVGGPPCQGFSHAGWRSQRDERNNLASVFMGFVEELEPEIVVLENVEGLLTYGKGRAVEDLLATLRELGYETGESPWFLHAECYGVPQMRRRVFLVGSRGGRPIPPPRGYLQRCLGRREANAGATLFADLPYPVTVAEALSDLPALGSRTHPSLGHRPVRPYFVQWAKGILSPAALRSVLLKR